ATGAQRLPDGPRRQRRRQTGAHVGDPHHRRHQPARERTIGADLRAWVIQRRRKPFHATRRRSSWLPLGNQPAVLFSRHLAGPVWGWAEWLAGEYRSAAAGRPSLAHHL